MRSNMLPLLVIGAAALVAIPLWATGSEAPVRFHQDKTGAAMLDATLEASRALLQADAARARLALDRIHEVCPTLEDRHREAFGDGAVSTDLTLHVTLNRARELSGAGDVEGATRELHWVQRTCTICHELSRRNGRLPAEGPYW